ncbi:MAG: type II toxin-antitoxin system HicA family toxin [Actinomycetota bacterium]|nr:type II toxin-antitoxin system HicA family toxin [Actinomycetota bacterium]
MTRLPRISGKDLLAALCRNGYEVVHIKGSHHYLRREGLGKIVVIPVHGSSIVPAGTLKSILRQAELTASELEKMLGN